MQTYDTPNVFDMIRFERYKTYDLSVSNIKHIVQVSLMCTPCLIRKLIEHL